MRLLTSVAAPFITHSLRNHYIWLADIREWRAKDLMGHARDESSLSELLPAFSFWDFQPDVYKFVQPIHTQTYPGFHNHADEYRY